MARSRRTSATLALFFAIAAPAGAAPSLQEVGRFARPVDVASAPGDLRLFVVEQQTGLVKIVDASGTILAEPFLNLRSQIAIDDNERGLLGLAFAPDYATSGLLYAFLTPPGLVEVREYRRTADPNRAEPTGRTLLSVAHPLGNHNGGGLRFGPDGMLWATVGDGGSANDPPNNAQNPNTLLGKIVRIDHAGGAPAIWALGLRNPWRFSFDRTTGDLVIADVGQDAREEVDFAPAAAGRLQGANYGWRCYEGSIDTPGVTCTPRLTGDVKPVHELTHGSPPLGDGACSITGGYVVRDPGLPTLAGRYLYGDLCIDRLRSITLGASDDRSETALAVEQVTTFAEDACGRVLVASLAGPVYRVVDGAPSLCAPPPPPGPGPGTPPPEPVAPAAQTCGLGARIPQSRSRGAALARGLWVRVSVRAACRVSATARIAGVGTLVGRARRLVAGQRATLRLRPGPRTRARLRRRRSASAHVTITARTDAGATQQARGRIRIRQRS